MARKPVTAEEAAAAADPAITDETVVVTADGVQPALAAAASAPAPAGDPAITDETVVVTADGIQPAPSVPAEPVPEAPVVPAGEPAAGFVVVTCGIAAGRRRAGRRWDAGTTRVHASEFSPAQMAELQADPVLRVSVEAA